MPTELRLSPGAPAPPVPPPRGPREPAVKRGRRRFSVVWLVALVAAAIAVWLAGTTLREQGPTVSIVFKTAEGLEAGKTKVRYKDIEVGTVQDLRLSDDLKNVVAVAELRKQVEPFVTEGTRWWVVRPRVGASGVSGLGTLISGAYIGLDPGRGERTLSFTGLEEPPPMTSDGRAAASACTPTIWARSTRARRSTTAASGSARCSAAPSTRTGAASPSRSSSTRRTTGSCATRAGSGTRAASTSRSGRTASRLRPNRCRASSPAGARSARRGGRVRHPGRRGDGRGAGGRPRVPAPREPAQGRRAGLHGEGALPGPVRGLGRRPPRRQPGPVQRHPRRRRHRRPAGVRRNEPQAGHPGRADHRAAAHRDQGRDRGRVGALRDHAHPGGAGPAGAARVRQPADGRAGRRARLPPRRAAGRARDGHRPRPRGPLGGGRPPV